MNVLQCLTELYNSESMDSIYKELARRILENLDEMRNVTIYDVAEITNSSRTTVWRLVQKLGYRSFSDFKYAIRSASSQYVYYNRMIEHRKNITSAELITDVSKQLTTAGKIYKKYLSKELLEELTDELSDSVRIHFYLPFKSSFVYSFQQNLWKDGKFTEYCCMIPEMLKAAEYLDEDSIVFMNILEFTETQDMSEVVQKIKKKGARLWIAGNSSSNFEEKADRILFMMTAEPTAWALAFDCFLLSLSEYYRVRFID